MKSLMGPDLTRLATFIALFLLTAAFEPSVNSLGRSEFRNSPSQSPLRTAPARSTSITRVKPLTVGEKLVYNVSWSNIPSAARLEIETAAKGLYHGHESYLLQTRVLTLNEGWSVFGEIDNQYSSYIDVRSSLPSRVVSSIRQGRVSTTPRDLLAVFDQTRSTATFSDGAQLTTSPSTFDLPSLLIALRTVSFAEGERKRFNVLFDQQLLEIDVEIAERRQLSIQSGNFNAVALRLSPRRLSKYRTILWLSDDSERTPLLIRAGTPLGEVRAELTGASVIGHTGLTSRAQNGPIQLSPAGSTNLPYPFKVGERLSYNISWGNFLNVGRASLEVRQSGLLNSQPVLELVGEASSSGPIRSVITVNDQVTSLVRTDSLIPIRTDLRLREGRRNKSDTAIFDHSVKTATLNNGTVVLIEAGTLDLVALFYNIRAADLKPGQTRQFNFLDANNRPRVVSVRGLLQENIASPTGPRLSTRIEISNQQNGVIAIGWISADGQKLPLQFSTHTRFGEIKFRLVSLVTN
ncbi:MAG: DUF3108 domain-containing protein [Acidobacteria bacterium]|nr:DUF3108 domain-containing protein [Acidobacteriota bacterium]